MKISTPLKHVLENALARRHLVNQLHGRFRDQPGSRGGECTLGLPRYAKKKIHWRVEESRDRNAHAEQMM